MTYSRKIVSHILENQITKMANAKHIDNEDIKKIRYHFRRMLTKSEYQNTEIDKFIELINQKVNMT